MVSDDFSHCLHLSLVKGEESENAGNRKDTWKWFNSPEWGTDDDLRDDTVPLHSQWKVSRKL